MHEIKEIMKKSRELGMQTFDQALFDLYEAGRISYEDALRNADSVNDLRLKIKLRSEERQEPRPGFGARSTSKSSNSRHPTTGRHRRPVLFSLPLERPRATRAGGCSARKKSLASQADQLRRSACFSPWISFSTALSPLRSVPARISSRFFFSSRMRALRCAVSAPLAWW